MACAEPSLNSFQRNGVVLEYYGLRRSEVRVLGEIGMEFCVHLVFGEEAPDFVENFRRIWTVVDSWEKLRHGWSFYVQKADIRKNWTRYNSLSTRADSVQSLIEELRLPRRRPDLEKYRLRASGAYELEHVRNGRFVTLDRYVDVQSCGNHPFHLDRRLWLANTHRSARIDFYNYYPYRTGFENDMPDREVWTEAVENNLKALEELLMNVITAAEPRAMRLFICDGDFTPLSSLWTYFSSPEVVLDDLSFIKEMWESGYPPRKVPLKSRDEAEWSYALPYQMNDNQKTKLCEELKASLPHLDRVTEEVIKQSLYDSALNIREIPTIQAPDGFAVRLSPHYMNGYVSQFYTEVLRKAGYL